MRRNRKLKWIGMTRSKTRFLLFPKRINDQWRWLETASWEEKLWYGTARHYWGPTQWID